MLKEDENEKKKEKKSSQETVKEMSANTGDKELKELHDIDKLDSGVAVMRDFGSYAGWLWLYKKRQLSAGRK